ADDGRDARPHVRRPDGDLGGARGRVEAAPPARLSGDRHLRAFDRGDRTSCAARGRGAEKRGMKNEKGHVPLRYWVLWVALLVFADFMFYVVLTPIWMGLRAVAWLAEFRARRRR